MMQNPYLLRAVLFLILFCPFLAHPGAAEEKITNSLGMTFVRIEAGTFQMGSPPDERFRNKSEKLHEVRIERPFYLQTTEVTRSQWWSVMGKKWLFPRKGPGSLPVTEVSWHNCRSFIRKLNKMEPGTYRLPTEAEWEYACRAGTRTAYSWGDTIDCSRAMFANSRLKADRCIPVVRSRGLSPNEPAPVRSYPPNPWGLYDMHGNVWEWCRDCFSGYPAPENPGRPECSRRVRRGGSWYSNAHNLRSANRAYAHPAAKFKTTGFRLVQEAP
jgi:formylglycine-generating enzyme required for sulfatase activity